MRRAQGFTYVIVMFLVAVLSVIALRGQQITLTKERREQEAQLLEAGLAYRKAIGAYYESSPGYVKTYPRTLAALLLDDRTSTTRRHLRKLYRDPVGAGAWGLVLADDGAIKGVFSQSDRHPVKLGNFPDGVMAAKDAAIYSEWRFVYEPLESRNR